jgi:hypothetical protein
MRTAYWAINQEKKETYMSKNLTRKGLALGTVAALGASLFAGTPANAAPTALYLESAFGTSTTGVLGQYFTVALSAQAGTDNDVIKFYVEGVAAADISAVARSAATKDASAANAGSYSITPAETDVSTSLKQVAYSTEANYDAGKFFELALKVNSTNVTSTTSVKVTPFLDSVVADGKPGTGELTGTAMTINFVKGSELTATPTVVGTTFAATAKASVAVSGGVNVEQFRLAADGGHAETPFTVLFTENGTDEGSANNALYDVTEKTLMAASTATVAAGDTWGAKAKINTVDSASATAVGAAAGEVESMTALAGSAGTSFKSSYVVSGVTTANVIRAGSGSYKVTTTVTAVAGKSKVGQKVTFTVKETAVSSMAAAATVTAGGKTLANSDATVQQEFDVDVVSDADGKATLELTYAGIAHGNTVNVAAKAKGATAVITPTTTTNVTFTGQDSVATAIVDPIQDGQAGTAVRNVARGGSFSIAYTVVDQFGQTPTGTFRVVATNTNATVTPSVASPIAVSAGKVTVSGTDNNNADDSFEIVATLQKLGSDGTTYAGLTSAVTETSTIMAQAVRTPATIAITAATTAGITRNGNTQTAGVVNIEQGSVSRTLTGGQTMSAVVTNSAGATVPGAAVTFSGTGVLFQAGGSINAQANGSFGLGSLVVYTDANGSTGNVYYYSNNTGKQTITVTSGAATKTQDISWAAVTTGGSAWTITAPTYILPGQTLKVSAVLKDKYGALVDTAAGDIKVAYTGPGFVTKDMATETDEDGAVSFTVLLGAGDTGSATVKFTYEGANGTIAETVLNDDIVGQAVIALGAAPVAGAVARVAGSTKRFFVSVEGNTLGRNVVVKVAGKTFKTLKGSTAKKSYAVAAPKGSHKVTVFVGGKLVATKTISVK